MILFSKIAQRYSCFIQAPNSDQFIFLMTVDDPFVLTWTGKFIFDSMHKRAALHMTQGQTNSP